jgi:hypothetical protein
MQREGVNGDCITSADVADYLRERVEEQFVAASTVHGDRAAIASHLKHTPQAAVMNSTLITDMMNILRHHATPSKPKLHVSTELMKSWIQFHDERVASNLQYEMNLPLRMPSAASMPQPPPPWRIKASFAWKQERDIFMMLIMMMAMLRESEATALRLENVEIKEEVVNGIPRRVMHIYIDQSKTDQNGIGAVVMLSENKDDPALCPLERFKKYRAASAKVEWLSIYLFPKTGGAMMASTTPCGIVQLAVDAANKRAKSGGFGDERWGHMMSYGSHSLRRGGVTAARSNGVSMLAIQQHGRWKSLTVFDYVGQNIGEQLEVTAGILDRPTAITGYRIADDRNVPTADVRTLAAAGVNRAMPPVANPRLSHRESATPTKRKQQFPKPRQISGRERVRRDSTKVRRAYESVSQSDDDDDDDDTQR